MKKTLSALLISGILLGTGVSTFAAAGDQLAAPKDGKTTLTIVDYTTDPTTKLPTAPGTITLDSVPDIDFGTHTLDDLVRNQPAMTGTFTNDLKVTDTRATAANITAAKAEIAAAKVPADGTAPTQANIDAANKAWENPSPVGPFKITALADSLEDIASTLTLQGKDVMTAAADVVSETSATAVGTKLYTGNLKDAVLKVKTSGLSVKQYKGKITYTLVNAQ